MGKRNISAYKILILIFALFLSGISSAQEQNKVIDTAKIEQLTGLKGVFNKDENVFKVSSPRSDVKISVDGWVMPPFMGLTSWVSFTAGSKEATMIMGDLVLFQDEVNPVMSLLLQNDIKVTALHNHFFYDDPKLYFMHINAEGKTDALAIGVGKVFDKIKEIRTSNPIPAKGFGNKQISEKSSITPKIIEDILGVKGQSQNGMFKIVIGRKTHMSCGCEVGKEMGINTWAGFAGTDDIAIVDGDFAMLESEVQSVLKVLRGAGINIVALHNHMLMESPRIVFLHFWGVGSTVNLAKGVRAALDIQQSQN